jgi:hypothetical protein
LRCVRCVAGTRDDGRFALDVPADTRLVVWAADGERVSRPVEHVVTNGGPDVTLRVEAAATVCVRAPGIGHAVARVVARPSGGGPEMPVRAEGLGADLLRIDGVAPGPMTLDVAWDVAGVPRTTRVVGTFAPGEVVEHVAK